MSETISVFCCIEPLEDRRLLAFNPSGKEQEVLELINRMRGNPAAELKKFLASTDPDIKGALSAFNVNKTVLAQQWKTLKKAPPLAWNEMLYNAATKHNQKMVANDVQSHQVPGELNLGGRAQAEGYSFSRLGENVFSYAKNPFQQHAAFAIDWGNGPNGIQNPPGHRLNIMSKEFTEAGISFLAKKAGASTGPFLTTHDFGAPLTRGNAFLIGTVRKERDRDGVYDAGEGLGNRRVKITGAAGTFTTTTLGAGAFQIRVPAGTYTVTVTGKGLGTGLVLANVVVGSNNVKKDFVVGA